MNPSRSQGNPVVSLKSDRVVLSEQSELISVQQAFTGLGGKLPPFGQGAVRLKRTGL